MDFKCEADQGKVIKEKIKEQFVLFKDTLEVKEELKSNIFPETDKEGIERYFVNLIY